MKIVLHIMWASFLAACLLFTGCAKEMHSAQHSGLVATIRLLSRPSPQNPLPDIQLTIQNQGARSSRLPEYCGEFFGNIMAVCEGDSIELRHRNLWKPYLSAVIIPDVKIVQPGQSVSYLLPVSTDYQSTKDIVRHTTAQLKGEASLVNEDTVQHLTTCREYQIYCTIDRSSLTSNVVSVRLRDN